MNGDRYLKQMKRPNFLFKILLITLLISTSSLEQETEIIPIKYVDRNIEKEAICKYYTTVARNEYIAKRLLYHIEAADIEKENIIFALVWRESYFRPDTVYANATSVDRGLLQLNSLEYLEYGDIEFFNIEWNIRKGIEEFAREWELVDRNYRYGLHAYNAGRSRRFNPPTRTARYASQILRKAEYYEKEKNKYIKTYCATQAQYIRFRGE